MALIYLLEDTKQITYSEGRQVVLVADPDDPTASTRIDMVLSIWTGAKGVAPPVDATVYNLSNPIGFYDTVVIGTVTQFRIDSYLSSEMFDQPFESDYLSSAVWYQFTVTSDNPNTPFVSDIKLATTGYGYYDDNTNAGTTITAEDGKVFGNQSSLLACDPSKSYIAPIYVGDTSTNKDIVTDTQTIELDTDLGITLGSLESDEQIALVPMGSDTFGAEWITGTQLEYVVTNVTGGNAPIYGIGFDGISQYMDLGIVPMLNGDSSYLKSNFKAMNWQSAQNPMGYNGGGERFYFWREGTPRDIYLLQTGTQFINDPATYPTPDDYNLFRVDGQAGAMVKITVDGNNLGTPPYTLASVSTRDFYIGSRNDDGTASNFCEVVYFDIEFYNGVTTKIFNDANNWNGATNHGGVRMVSYDSGVTWETANTNEYKLDIECSKGSPMGLIYYNASGAQTELPINGQIEEAIAVVRERFSNRNFNQIDGSWDTTAHERRTFTVNGRESYDVQTGWIGEETKLMIKELMLSKSVWLVKGGVNIPVNIMNLTQRYINRIYENRVGYTFNLQEANQVIG
jgi:hypothetical protein